jgi:hypothetical protein
MVNSGGLPPEASARWLPQSRSGMNPQGRVLLTTWSTRVRVQLAKTRHSPQWGQPAGPCTRTLAGAVQADGSSSRARYRRRGAPVPQWRWHCSRAAVSRCCCGACALLAGRCGTLAGVPVPNIAHATRPQWRPQWRDAMSPIAQALAQRRRAAAAPAASRVGRPQQRGRQHSCCCGGRLSAARPSPISPTRPNTSCRHPVPPCCAFCARSICAYALRRWSSCLWCKCGCVGREFMSACACAGRVMKQRNLGLLARSTVESFAVTISLSLRREGQ